MFCPVLRSNYHLLKDQLLDLVWYVVAIVQLVVLEVFVGLAV